MQVVILARSAADARAYRDAARLPRRGTFCPADETSLRGLVLHDDDLVAEIPGFREHPHADEILVALQTAMGHGEVPRWERITG